MQEQEGLFRIERLYHCRAQLGQLIAHPDRACVLSAAGGLVVCSAAGTVELASLTHGQDVDSACWSPCGNFLFLGDKLGVVHLFHVPTQVEVWTRQVAQGAHVFAGLCCSAAAAPARGGLADVESIGPRLLCLLAGGTLLRSSCLGLAQLDADLQAFAGSGQDLQPVAAGALLDVAFSPHALPEDVQQICLSSAGMSCCVYAAGAQTLCAYTVAADALLLHDLVTLPALLLDGACDAEEAEDKLATPSGSPPKRRRTAEETPSLAYLALWPGSGADVDDIPEDFPTADTMLVLVFRRPGIVMLYDAHILLEVSRWRPPGGADVSSAAILRVPEAVSGDLADLDCSGAGAGALAGFAAVAVVLASGDLLVWSFLTEQILFSVSLGLCCQGGPAALSGALVAAVGDQDGEGILAFLAASAKVEGTDGEVVLCALCAACGEEDGGDRSGDIEDSLSLGGLEGPAPAGIEGECEQVPAPAGGCPTATPAQLSVPRLRRQLELFLERAAQGLARLESGPFLRMARQLVRHIPGFVVGSAVAADFATPSDLRAVLQGVLRLLLEGGLPSTYDGARGAARLGDALSRLATMEFLHASLAGTCTRAADPPRAAHQWGGERAPPMLASPRGRRCSLASGAAKAAGTAGEARRRHSLPVAPDARASVGEEGHASRSVIALLSDFDALEGPAFQAAWRQMRQAEVRQVCMELAATGHLAQALGAFACHRGGGSLSAEDALGLLEQVPTDISDLDEERLAFWVSQEALPLFACRAQLVGWLVSRAELLESRDGRPDSALRLLGTVLSTAAPLPPHPAGASGSCSALPLVHRAAEEARCFPESRVLRGLFWSGAQIPASPTWLGAWRGTRPGATAGGPRDAATARMLDLFCELQACSRIRSLHGLAVSLQDVRERHSGRRIAAQLLDRVLAPDLLPEEVRVHVAPFCEAEGICADEVIEEYVLDLADGLCLQDGELRLHRAAALVPCLACATRRARCVLELLKRWPEATVPSELHALVQQGSDWSFEHQTAVKDQMALIDVQRILRKHGLVGEASKEVQFLRMPWYNTRIVYHLLSRVHGDIASLKDSLAILAVFPQQFTRSEALFIRLTHIAAAVQGEQVLTEPLLRESQQVLECAATAGEKAIAVSTFASYSADVLGEWAGGIEMCSGAVGCEAAVAAWKLASCTLCELVLAILRCRATSSVAASRGGATVEPEVCGGSAWNNAWGADVFRRLKCLQAEFDLYLDPLAIMGGCAGESDAEVGPPSSSLAEGGAAAEVLRHVAGRLLRPPEPRSAAEPECVEALPDLSDAEPHDGRILSRLMRLGSLLGLSPSQACRTVLAEASARGRFALCLASLPGLLRSAASGVGDAGGAAGVLLREMLAHLATGKDKMRASTALLTQMEQVEDFISDCLACCSPGELPALLELAGDVRFLIELLFSSDLLETSPKSRTASPQLWDSAVADGGCSGAAASRAAASPLAPQSQDKSRSQGRTGAAPDLPGGLAALGGCFQEIPLLIPRAAAAQVGLEYLEIAPRGSAASREGRPVPAPVDGQLPRGPQGLLAFLRSRECLQLAMGLLMRHPQAFSASDFRHLARERAARVLRAGSVVDHRLAVAYLGCLEVRDALDLFVSSLCYLRTEQQRNEQHRLRRFARLGTDLAVLWGNVSFHLQMQVTERNAKWSQRLAQLSVSFEAARLFDYGAAPQQALTDGASTASAAAAATLARHAYARTLLPHIARRSGLDLQLMLQFATDQGLAKDEALALFAELSLATRRLDHRNARAVPKALAQLPAEAAESLLLTRVLPVVSPYDYERLEIVLGLLERHPRTESRRQVLRHLRGYRRQAAPGQHELDEIVTLTSRLAKLHVLEGGQEQACAEMRRAAVDRLPWHALALGGDPWPALAPELKGPAEVAALLPLCVPLALLPDDFYVRALRQVSPKAEPEEVKALLYEVQDPHRAAEAAEAVEDALPLGPARLAVVHARLELQPLLRRGSTEGQGSPSAVQRGAKLLQEHAHLLESRWDLERHGLGVFTEALTKGGPQSCISCLYHYLPTLLWWPNAPGAGGSAVPSAVADTGAAAAARGAKRLGVAGIHDVVDGVCTRHGLAPKQVRHQLLEQWLRQPTWLPEHPPPELAQAASLQLRALASGMSEAAATASGASASGAAGATDCGKEAQLNTFSVPPTLSAHMFRQSPEEVLCIERAAILAHPRHCRSTQDVSRELREDIKTRCIFLLRIVFTKETCVSYDAKCRALAVLFRIASPEDIVVAYRNPVEELRDIWKLYFYMDIFERLGVPQDFKRFYQCNKEGLARSLWRSHQGDPQMAQVVAALCLDFSVSDGRFWASILSSLRSLRLHGFLADLLAALHERPPPELRHDQCFAAALAEALGEPVAALQDWGAAAALAGAGGTGSKAAPPCTARLLTLLPSVLRGSGPDLDALALTAARALLLASQAQGADVVSLCGAIFGRLRAVAGLALEDGVTEEEACRVELGILAFDIALSQASAETAGAFVREEVVAQHPSLIPHCLPRCAGAVRRALLRGAQQAGLLLEPSLGAGELGGAAGAAERAEEEDTAQHCALADFAALLPPPSAGWGRAREARGHL